MKKLDIKRALLEHHMTQVELAQKTGIIAQNISAIIKGGNPTVAKLIQITEGIGCDITDLFYSETEDTGQQKNYRQMIIKLNQYKRLSWRTLSFKQKLSAHIFGKSIGLEPYCNMTPTLY